MKGILPEDYDRLPEHGGDCYGANCSGDCEPVKPDIPTRLLALWHEANEEMAKAGGQAGFEDAFNYWSGATKDLLIAIGYEWNDAAGDYVLRTTSDRPSEGDSR